MVLRTQATEIQIYASAFLIKAGFYFAAVKSVENDGRLMRSLVRELNAVLANTCAC